MVNIYVNMDIEHLLSQLLRRRSFNKSQKNLQKLKIFYNQLIIST